MEDLTLSNIFHSITSQGSPEALAWIKGNKDYPNLCGRIFFFSTPFSGIIISGEVYGLPTDSDFFGLHIHEFGDCTPPFEQTGGHYNPTNALHPEHSGDLPPLLGNDGYAFFAYYTNRLSINEIIEKSIIIHSQRDDFTSQPAGDSGMKIGCGVIKKYR